MESQGICSDSGQTICNLLCFVSKYAYPESKFSPIFGASLRSPSYFLLRPTSHCVIILHRMNRFKRWPSRLVSHLALLRLYMNICPKVRGSQGKLALKSQGFLSELIAGNPEFSFFPLAVKACKCLASSGRSRRLKDRGSFTMSQIKINTDLFRNR